MVLWIESESTYDVNQNMRGQLQDKVDRIYTKLLEFASYKTVALEIEKIVVTNLSSEFVYFGIPGIKLLLN